MKVKLLKKVRKRFTITHYPNGIRLGDTFYDYNVFKITDTNEPHWADYSELSNTFKINDKKFCEDRFSTKKECIDFLLKKVLRRIRAENPNLGNKGHNKTIKKKVWYV